MVPMTPDGRRDACIPPLPAPGYLDPGRGTEMLTALIALAAVVDRCNEPAQVVDATIATGAPTATLQARSTALTMSNWDDRDAHCFVMETL